MSEEITQAQWKRSKLDQLEVECSRVMQAIRKSRRESYLIGADYRGKEFAALKRATLDLNRVGVEIRKGYWNRNS